MQNQQQDTQILILSNDEQLGATLRVLLASLRQTRVCAAVKTASALLPMLHHGLEAVFVDASELHGHKGKGLAERVTDTSALIVLARDGGDAVLAFEREATDCVPLPLLPARVSIALERASRQLK